MKFFIFKTYLFLK